MHQQLLALEYFFHSPEDRAADRKTALTILGKSLLLAAIATGVVLVLPF